MRPKKHQGILPCICTQKCVLESLHSTVYTQKLVLKSLCSKVCTQKFVLETVYSKVCTHKSKVCTQELVLKSSHTYIYIYICIYMYYTKQFEMQLFNTTCHTFVIQTCIVICYWIFYWLIGPQSDPISPVCGLPYWCTITHSVWHHGRIFLEEDHLNQLRAFKIRGGPHT